MQLLPLGAQHAPLAQVNVPQPTHAAPLLPQVPLFCIEYPTQVLPWQQPLGQPAASQRHIPPTQWLPAGQAALVPQRQPPPAQASAVTLEQPVHAEPDAPHWASVGGATQPVGEQHPEGQLVPSHTHNPPVQRKPAPHAVLEPQRQAPLVQVSAVMPQLMHAAPFEPHAPGLGLVQLCMAQQPLEQELESHTQAPLKQCWPAPHADPAPQWHAPLAQLSDEADGQARHALPIEPHAMVLLATHEPP